MSLVNTLANLYKILVLSVFFYNWFQKKILITALTFSRFTKIFRIYYFDLLTFNLGGCMLDLLVLINNIN